MQGLGHICVDHSQPAVRRAAAALMAARAAISERSIRIPEIGKFSTARWVWAPQRARGRDPDLAHRVVLDPVLAIS